MAKRIFLINLFLWMLIHALCFASIRDDTQKIPAAFQCNEIDGEIVAIDAGSVVITEAGIRKQYKLDPQVKIFCNGLIASWQSLLPVTSQAFFDTYAVLNSRNQVIILDGFYHGEECVILEWRFRNGELCIRITSAVDYKNQWRFVKTNARLPNQRWLIVGQVIYALYSRDDQIRGVYLPD